MAEDLQRDVRAARRAAELLNDPVMLQAFSDLEQQYIDAWKRCDSAEEREFFWYHQRALTDVQAQLRACVGSGEIASRKLDTERRRA
jgi:hypothetical protein